MMDSVISCRVCGAAVDPDGPAVEVVGSAGRTHWWVPFVEDLRRTSPNLIHWRCYLEQHGVDALMALIALSDRERREFIRLMRRTVDQERRARSDDEPHRRVDESQDRSGHQSTTE
jgi:hypothetical protein